MQVVPLFSVRHAVEDEIDPYAIGQGGIPLGIFRAVGPFPGVSHVRVMADGHHDASVVVTNRPPFGIFAIGIVNAASPDIPGSGNLKSLVQIVHDVKNLIAVAQLFDRAIRQNHAYPAQENLPFAVAMGIVDHKEAAS